MEEMQKQARQVKKRSKGIDLKACNEIHQSTIQLLKSSWQMHSSNLLLTSVRNRLMNTAMTENFVISFVISRYVEPEVYMGA